MKFVTFRLILLFLMFTGAMSAQKSASILTEQSNLKKNDIQKTRQSLVDLPFFSQMQLHAKQHRPKPNIQTTTETEDMTIHYVNLNATGNDDGTSWEDAFTDLQDALAAAALNDQIWVATGTYRPGVTDSATFYIAQDLELYGGFVGTETSLNERDIDGNPTILSGDLLENDVENNFEINREDNAMTVLLIESTVTTATILDGLVIQGGQADGNPMQLPLFYSGGGGVFSFGAAQFRNCLFQQNMAVVAPGLVFMESFSVGGRVENCRFENNMTGSNTGGGGGLGAYFAGEIGIVVENSHFSNNQAMFGGAIVGANSNLNIHNCTFNRNISNAVGGAIYNISLVGYTNGTAMIDNCTFTNNLSEGSGGAIFNEIGGTAYLLEVSNSTFANNTSNRFAGALEVWAPTNDLVSKIFNCVFNENEGTYGGAFYFESQGKNNQNTLTKCTFNNNIAIEHGDNENPNAGAVRHLFGEDSFNSSASIDDCTFDNNTSGNIGGAIQNFMYGIKDGISIKNTTFNSNSASFLGGACSTYAPTDSISVSFSNCDFNNNEAIISGGIFYETEGSNNVLMLKTSNFFGNKSIAASPDDEPWGGGLGILFDDDIISENNMATIDSCHFEDNICEALGGGAFIYDLGLNNSLHLTNTSFLSNSGVQGGALQYQTAGNNHQIKITNCNFTNNDGTQNGGGCQIQNSGLTLQVSIENCLFDENNATNDGGGLDITSIQGQTIGIIQNNEFINNTAGNEGSGFSLSTSGNATAQVLVESNLFAGNQNNINGNAVAGAGGFSLNNFSTGAVNIDFKTSIFENNSSEDGAGAIQLYKILSTTTDSITFDNCLLTKNIGGDYAGGLSLNGEIHLAVNNITIADNQNLGILVVDGQVDLQNSIVFNPDTEDLFAGDISAITSKGGNVVGDNTMNDILTTLDKPNQDPLFVADSYQLSELSPAVDVGIDFDMVTDFDLAGNDRVQGAAIDAGAYESSFFSSDREVIVDNTALTLFPNPAINNLTITLDNVWIGDCTVRIFNAIGQEVILKNLHKTANTAQQWQIEVSKLIAGFYEMTISDGKQMIVRSFVKQ